MSMDNQYVLDEANAEEASKFTGGAIFVGILMVIGVVGNLHVLLVYGLRVKQSNRRVFILVLGSMDLVTCVVCMPFILIDLHNPFEFYMVAACKMLRFNNYFICISSSWLLFVIAIDRYRKVCTPLGKQVTRTTAKVLCAVALAWSFALSWPAAVLYGENKVWIETSRANVTGVNCGIEDRYEDTKYMVYYNFVLILVYIAATLMLIILYTSMWRVIKTHLSLRNMSGVVKFRGQQGSETDQPYNTVSPCTEDSCSSTIIALGSAYACAENVNVEVPDVCPPSLDENQQEAMKVYSIPPPFQKQAPSGITRDNNNVKQERSKEHTYATKTTRGYSMRNRDSIKQLIERKKSKARQTTVMFFLISVIFFLSFVPHATLKAVGLPRYPTWSKTGQTVYNTVVWCFFVNNVANPIVYFFFDASFKRQLTMMGKGVLIEGTIQKRCHFAVTDSTKQKRHYYILFLKIQRAHKRKFDDKGAEIEANFSETKKVNSGYLNSSYRVEAKGYTDRLTDDQTRSLINKAELTKHTDKHGAADLLPLWLEESLVTSIEFELADSVRVKTRGDGPFVASITKLDTVASNVCNYAGGESVGASWTDKIMDMKGQAPTTQDNEGVEDDEWDD